MKNKYPIIVVAISSLIILVSILGYTYSYFSGQKTETGKTKTVIKSDELNLIFTGETEINAKDIIPGTKFTKTFSVKSEATKELKYNIYMENITNGFTEDLVYTLKKGADVVVEETPLPVTNKGKSYLKVNAAIAAGATDNYTLEVEFKYTDEDQSENQGAVFNGTLGIDANTNAYVASNQLVHSDGITAYFGYENYDGTSSYWINQVDESNNMTLYGTPQSTDEGLQLDYLTQATYGEMTIDNSADTIVYMVTKNVASGVDNGRFIEINDGTNDFTRKTPTVYTHSGSVIGYGSWGYGNDVYTEKSALKFNVIVLVINKETRQMYIYINGEKYKYVGFNSYGSTLYLSYCSYNTQCVSNNLYKMVAVGTQIHSEEEIQENIQDLMLRYNIE